MKCPFCQITPARMVNGNRFYCETCKIGCSVNKQLVPTLITYNFIDPEKKFYALQIDKHRRAATLWVCSVRHSREEPAIPATYLEIRDIEVDFPQPSQALELTRRLHNLLVFS